MENGKKLFETKFGFFDSDGNEYVITSPETPRPWVNVISPGDYGILVSQTGGGYSWKTHASLNRITRWNQDLVSDDWGKYIYIRDKKTGEFWSPTWKPVCQKPQFYECRHGFGYSKFSLINSDVKTELTLFVPPSEPLEIWKIRIENLSSQEKSLSFYSYFEWCLGESPDSHREFHKTFIETELDETNRTIFAKKRLWTIPNSKGQHWNRSWEYVAWHSVSLDLSGSSRDKDSFLGSYAHLRAPLALTQGDYGAKTTGKWDDAIGSLRNEIELKPGESKTILWTLGAAKSKKEALSFAKKYQDLSKVEQAFDSTKNFWKKYLNSSELSTPDSAFNLMANRWLKYQALSGRIWGRTGYYQAGGAIGYRDQLQDSQVFLSIDPQWTKKQILLHANHQYPDGTVQHWWHPITNEGHKSKFSDDLLWLPFITVNYLKETGDFSILKEKISFLPFSTDRLAPVVSLYEHCRAAIEHSLKRQSKRGLPLIGTGDWNDGLSVTGWEEKGESVWVAQFLYGILNNFCELIRRGIQKKVIPPSEKSRIQSYQKSAKNLCQAVNRFGWDGKWYWAASCDDGTLVGSQKSKEGKIHLNAQTWAILNGIVPEERIKTVLNSIEKYLYRDYGPLVLYPAYKTPDERIGYLTRYAPGVRENGGLYTHAGIWAIQMECFLKRSEKVWELFKKISPIDRGMDPELYRCEPYVTPGNVDGPDSPYYGRGGWTWYTGSAAWLYRIMTEWMIGVRPEWDGLKIDPCVPKDWDQFKTRRIYQGKNCSISFIRDPNLKKGVSSLEWNGQLILSNLITPEFIASLKNGGGKIGEKDIDFILRFN